MTSSRTVSLAPFALPDQASTRNGLAIDPRCDRWTFKDQSRAFCFDFADLAKALAPPLMLPLKLVLLHYLRLYSASHANNLFQRFQHFSRMIYGITGGSKRCHVMAEDIINYKGALAKRDEWYLGALKGFLKTWHHLGYPGVDPDAIRLLNQMKLAGNSKGDHVRSMDPEEGPFTAIEEQAIQGALNDGFARGEISLREFVLAWLELALGHRPSQYASLKVCDLSCQQIEGSRSYILQMPRAKQRGVLARDLFRPRSLISEIGDPLAAWCAAVEETYLALIADGVMAPLSSSKECPIFPKWDITGMPPGLEHHSTGEQMTKELQHALKKLSITSERTGTMIKINSRRFKYTKGTRAAEEGYGPLIIADILDHEDTQNVGVYTEATPKMAERIDKRMAMSLAPLAQAFAGVLIENEGQARRRKDPASRIRSNGDPTKSVGSCGKFGFCGAFAPIACYTCTQFQPWLGGPHEEVLDKLLKGREHVLKATGDLRIAAVNDRTIYAVAQVIQMCADRSEMA